MGLLPAGPSARLSGMSWRPCWGSPCTEDLGPAVIPLEVESCSIPANFNGLTGQGRDVKGNSNEPSIFQWTPALAPAHFLLLDGKNKTQEPCCPETGPSWAPRSFLLLLLLRPETDFIGGGTGRERLVVTFPALTPTASQSPICSGVQAVSIHGPSCHSVV